MHSFKIVFGLGLYVGRSVLDYYSIQIFSVLKSTRLLYTVISLSISSIHDNCSSENLHLDNTNKNMIYIKMW